jgi:hypothetical protein
MPKIEEYLLSTPVGLGDILEPALEIGRQVADLIKPYAASGKVTPYNIYQEKPIEEQPLTLMKQSDDGRIFVKFKANQKIAQLVAEAFPDKTLVKPIRAKPRGLAPR